MKIKRFTLPGNEAEINAFLEEHKVHPKHVLSSENSIVVYYDLPGEKEDMPLHLSVLKEAATEAVGTNCLQYITTILECDRLDAEGAKASTTKKQDEVYAQKEQQRKAKIEAARRVDRLMAVLDSIEKGSFTFEKE